jgi:hypothetical protein
MRGTAARGRAGGGAGIAATTLTGHRIRLGSARRRIAGFAHGVRSRRPPFRPCAVTTTAVIARLDPVSMLSCTLAWTKPSGDKAEVHGFAAGGEWHI